MAATERSKYPLRSEDRIGIRVGKVIDRYKVGKHVELTITDTSFSYQENFLSVAEEAALDGIYVLHTSVSKKKNGRPGRRWCLQIP